MLRYIQQPAMQDSTTVRARRPGTTTAGLSTGKETATSGCNQPHQAFHPVSIHQMAPPERVRSIRTSDKQLTSHLSTPEG